MKYGDLDLAPIGNCAVSALIDRQGRYVWACVPRVDGDPMFCALLGGKAVEEPQLGVWAIDLIDQVSAEQRYERNTPILVTTLTDARGDETHDEIWLTEHEPVYTLGMAGREDHVRDTGCTLKAMRRDCREALLLFNGMHRFIPALIRNMGWRVTEMPVNHRPRIHGVSKYGFGNRALRATMDMFGVRWLNSRRMHDQAHELYLRRALPMQQIGAIDALMTQLREDPAGAPTVAAMAAGLGLEADRFTRLFRRRSGLSPRGWPSARISRCPPKTPSSSASWNHVELSIETYARSVTFVSMPRVKEN